MSKLSTQDVVVEIYVIRKRDSMYPLPVSLVESIRFKDIATKQVFAENTVSTSIELPIEYYEMVLDKSYLHTGSTATGIVAFDIIIGGLLGCSGTIKADCPILYTRGFTMFVLANDQLRKSYKEGEFLKTCMSLDLTLSKNKKVEKFRREHGWSVIPVVKER